MTRRAPLLLLVILSLLVVSTFGFAAGFKSSKASVNSLSKLKLDEKNGLIIGKFTMVHTRWNYIDPKIKDQSEDVNIWSTCILTGLMMGKEDNQKINFDFKPISGSNFEYKEALLKKNDADPYWVFEVPPGTYDLATITFELELNKPNYYPFAEKMLTVAFSRDLKRNISVTVNPKQIVYIGDYNIDFKTNVILYKLSGVYPFNQMKLALTNNFDQTKAALFEMAEGKSKEKLNQFEIVNGIQD